MNHNYLHVLYCIVQIIGVSGIYNNLKKQSIFNSFDETYTLVKIQGREMYSSKQATVSNVLQCNV